MPRIISIHYQRLVCIFERAGFLYSRTRGDHLVYIKPGATRPLVIPMYDQVPVFVITNLLRTAGMNRAHYFEFLDEC